MKSKRKIKYKAENRYIQISDAFGELLSRYEWQYFGVLTFRSPLYKDYVRNAMDELMKYIRAPKHSSAFWASEFYNTSSERHVHIITSTGQPKEKIKFFWEAKYGNCWIEDFDIKKRGEHYVSKFTGYSTNDFDIMINPRMKIRVDRSFEELGEKQFQSEEED